MSNVFLVVSDAITLCTWETRSASLLFALTERNRPYLQRWLPWVPTVRTPADSENFILTSHKKWQDQTGLELGIWYKNELTGCIGLHELNRDQSRTVIGYWLGAEFQGHGIMTAAVSALTTYCFEVQNFDRVEISAAPENTKSRAIPERLGFVQEGIIHQPELINGEYQDSVGYRMLKKDWGVSSLRTPGKKTAPL